MESISQFFHTVLTPDGIQHLILHGGYIALFLIVFAETGLLIGFFLPGDSLMVTTGLLISSGTVQLDLVLLILILIAAAVIGDATGYLIGRKSGPKLYNRPDSRLFKREHLQRTQKFYEKHGGKTIIVARFIPIIRTFAPVVAGAADMGYQRFAMFNIIGAILWVVATTMLGYLLAHLVPNIAKYLDLVIIAVVVLSMIPPFVEWLKHRKAVGN